MGPVGATGASVARVCLYSSAQLCCLHQHLLLTTAGTSSSWPHHDTQSGPWWVTLRAPLCLVSQRKWKAVWEVTNLKSSQLDWGQETSMFFCFYYNFFTTLLFVQSKGTLHGWRSGRNGGKNRLFLLFWLSSLSVFLPKFHWTLSSLLNSSVSHQSKGCFLYIFKGTPWTAVQTPQTCSFTTRLISCWGKKKSCFACCKPALLCSLTGIALKRILYSLWANEWLHTLRGNTLMIFKSSPLFIDLRASQIACLFRTPTTPALPLSLSCSHSGLSAFPMF